jgi:hypothetical protein
MRAIARHGGAVAGGQFTTHQEGAGGNEEGRPHSTRGPGARRSLGGHPTISRDLREENEVLAGASGFEPPTSWSRTRRSNFSRLSTIGYPVLLSTTYQDYGEDRGMRNSCVVGTILGTGPATSKAQAHTDRNRRYDPNLNLPTSAISAHIGRSAAHLFMKPSRGTIRPRYCGGEQ